MADTVEAAAESAARIATSTQAQLIVDDDCVCLEASLGASRLLGRSRGHLAGHDTLELFEPDARERFVHIWQAFRETGGEAAPFVLAPPATTDHVAVAVVADVLPGRHLLRISPAPPLDGARPAAASRRPLTSRGGRRPSARECEVLGLLATGQTDIQIAAELGLSPATIQTHVRNAKAKLGARTRAQAVALAIQHELIPSG